MPKKNRNGLTPSSICGISSGNAIYEIPSRTTKTNLFNPENPVIGKSLLQWRFINEQGNGLYFQKTSLHFT